MSDLLKALERKREVLAAQRKSAVLEERKNRRPSIGMGSGGYNHFSVVHHYRAGFDAAVSLLIGVVETADDAMAQIKDQRGMWPGEVDTLDDALEKLREDMGE